MKKSKLLLALIILFSVCFFTGCFGVNAEFYKLKHSVFSKIGKDYYTDVEFSVGSISISLAKSFVSFADDDDEEDIEAILRNVSHVQVGVYKTRNHKEAKISKGFFNNINKDLTDDGWQYILRDRDKKSLTTVYYKSNKDNEIVELFVVNMDNDELVIANIEGNFDEFVAEELSKGKFKIDM